MATTMPAQRAHAQVQWGSGGDMVAGVWLIIAPFTLNYAANGGSVANDVTVGIIVLLLAAARVMGNNYRVSWPSWLNVVLGVWLIIAPFALGYPSGSGAMYNDIILGIIVTAFALTSAIPAQDMEEQ